MLKLGKCSLFMSIFLVILCFFNNSYCKNLYNNKQYIKNLQVGNIKKYLPQIPKNFEVKEDNGYKNAKLIIFISSSMPMDTIRNFIKDTEDIYNSTYFVIRGFVKGMKKFKPTREWILKVLCADNPPGSPDCLSATIDINPNLFKEFNIKMVPAIMVIENGNLQGCSLNQQTLPDVFISYGDANVKYHLSRMEEAGSVVAHNLLQKFKNQYYDME